MVLLSAPFFGSTERVCTFLLLISVFIAKDQDFVYSGERFPGNRTFIVRGRKFLGKPGGGSNLEPHPLSHVTQLLTASECALLSAREKSVQ